MDYSKTRTNKMGKVGENAIEDNFLWEDVTLKEKCPDNKSFPYDFKYVSNKTGKVFYVDAKTKTSRDYYPDNGIDLKDFLVYMNIVRNEKVDFFLFFVDYETNSCYYLNLAKLDDYKRLYNPVPAKLGKMFTYPLYGQGAKGEEMIYFPLAWMKTMFRLEKSTLTQLRNLADAYKPICQKYYKRLLMQVDQLDLSVLDNCPMEVIDGLLNFK